jgi:hypothetical protein
LATWLRLGNPTFPQTLSGLTCCHLYSRPSSPQRQTRGPWSGQPTTRCATGFRTRSPTVRTCVYLAFVAIWCSVKFLQSWASSRTSCACDFFRTMFRIQRISLSLNHLTGGIPDEMGKLSNFIDIYGW